MSTTRQHQMIAAIRALNAAGVEPSHERLRERLGLKSRSGVNRLLVLLREQGRVDWSPHRAGSLRLIEGPTRAEVERWSDAELHRVHDLVSAVQYDRDLDRRAAA